MTETEKPAWLPFKVVCLNFLGNVKAEYCKEIVKDLLNVHPAVGCNISLKIHFFTFQPGLVPSELGRSERRTRGKIPSGFFNQGEKICGKLVTGLVS
jgi:hypothetical protein